MLFKKSVKKDSEAVVLICRPGLLVLTVLLLGMMGGLSGCAETRKALGYDKSAPDEFRVIKRAPLKVPTAFGLPPPVPGTHRPQEQNPAAQVYEVLTGRSLAGQSDISYGVLSTSLRVLLHVMNVYHALPNIRAIVDREAVTILLERRSMTDRVVFWREVIPESGPVVDAEKELRRLQENRALGHSINEGTVPLRVPRRRGILEHLF